MTHLQKVDHLIEELGHKGVGYYTAGPPLFRLLWKLGSDIPPPFFLEFRKLALMIGTFFGVLEGLLWGMVMWFSSWQGEIPAAIAVALTVFEAVLAGMLSARSSAPPSPVANAAAIGPRTVGVTASACVSPPGCGRTAKRW